VTVEEEMEMLASEASSLLIPNGLNSWFSSRFFS
jgi:hypothetical protein